MDALVVSFGTKEEADKFITAVAFHFRYKETLVKPEGLVQNPETKETFAKRRLLETFNELMSKWDESLNPKVQAADHGIVVL